MKVIAQLGQKLTDKDLGAPLDALNDTALVSMTDVKGRILASEEASYITGATLYIDGGWLAA